jgi:putative glutamine amidotransferase|tara:strand:+ start:768 stop:1511 length:744 start_codon:yes stop_codon:yes gene_type:complete
MKKIYNRPLIGITLDSEEPGGYSNMPWYALRKNYSQSITQAGGLAIALPHEPENADLYLDKIDGLVITGGAFDVDPIVFGSKQRHHLITTKDERTKFELAITRRAIFRDIPILGICGGQQLLHVVLGGTLIQHIPDEVDGSISHEQPNPRNEPGHVVKITKDTLLYRIVQKEELEVNSAHHQAAKDIPLGVTINAISPDGIIEGIEAKGQKFCLGVQWHPEYGVSEGDKAIFEAFVASSSTKETDNE